MTVGVRVPARRGGSKVAAGWILGLSVTLGAQGFERCLGQEGPALEPPRVANASPSTGGSSSLPVQAPAEAVPPPPAPELGPAGQSAGASPGQPAPVATQAQTDADAEAPQPPGVEVQTRGPVHEAFANPVVFNPKPGPVIAKQPPDPVQEQPPDQKPEGDDVQWIPGYWAWDTEREDYLWVSGLWRIPPPGRQWVPGYWREVQGGYQWTPGAWTNTEREEMEYLPEPPRTLEAGPNVPQPSGQAVWSPGSWVWQGRRYVWRPGCWITAREDWLWVPPHYVWSPSGYLFIDGYWDYPVATRGILFAPVVFAPSVLVTPGFVYRPSFGIVTSVFSTNLFVRPGWGCYYFGDYYASTYLSVGIFPWFQFQYSRVGFDPFYANAFALNVGINPGWATSVQNNYIFLRNNAPARPPRTLIAQRNITVNRTVNVNNTIIQNGSQNQAVIAQPISQLGRDGAGGGRGPRLERVAAERRAIYAQRQEQLHELRLARLERETSLARDRAEIVRSRADMFQSRSETAQARQGAAAARAEARVAEARAERVVSARLPRSPISSPKTEGVQAAAGNGPGAGAGRAGHAPRAADAGSAARMARGTPPPPPTDAAVGRADRADRVGSGRVGSLARRSDITPDGISARRAEAGRVPPGNARAGAAPVAGAGAPGRAAGSGLSERIARGSRPLPGAGERVKEQARPSMPGPGPGPSAGAAAARAMGAERPRRHGIEPRLGPGPRLDPRLGAGPGMGMGPAGSAGARGYPGMRSAGAGAGTSPGMGSRPGGSIGARGNERRGGIGSSARRGEGSGGGGRAGRGGD